MLVSHQQLVLFTESTTSTKTRSFRWALLLNFLIHIGVFASKLEYQVPARLLQEVGMVIWKRFEVLDIGNAQRRSVGIDRIKITQSRTFPYPIQTVAHPMHQKKR